MISPEFRPSGLWNREISPVPPPTIDEGVAMLVSLIGSPKEWILSLGLYVIRVRETSDIPHVIDVLSQV